MNKSGIILAVAVLGFSSAYAAPVKTRGPKVETKIETVKPSVRPEASASGKAATGFKGSNGLLGAGLATGQENLKNANQVLDACNGTPLISDMGKALPSAAEQSSFARYAAILGGQVQSCTSGEKLNDAQALINFGRMVIFVGQEVEAGTAKANDRTVWARALKKSIEAAGGAISLDQAVINVNGLTQKPCEYLKL